MRRNNEPDKMQRALGIITVVMTGICMYRCWQVDQLRRIL